MASELAGTTCVITGAARGIGASIAATFSREDGRVVVLDFDAEAGRMFADRLNAAGADAHFQHVDVRDESSVATAAATVAERFGGVDVLVNNAGVSRLGPTFEFTMSAWSDSIAVMQTGVFLCSREFGRLMRDGGGGTIVNVSSINGLTAFPGRLAYSAAKAAVVSMTRLLAVEWASYGIRVNAIAPGITDTGMLTEAVEAGLIDPESYIDRIPMRRFAQPEEMADAVLFLASRRSSYVTGQIIAVDGGWTAFGWVPWDGDPAGQPSVGVSDEQSER